MFEDSRRVPNTWSAKTENTCLPGSEHVVGEDRKHVFLKHKGCTWRRCFKKHKGCIWRRIFVSPDLTHPFGVTGDIAKAGETFGSRPCRRAASQEIQRLGEGNGNQADAAPIGEVVDLLCPDACAVTTPRADRGVPGTCYDRAKVVFHCARRACVLDRGELILLGWTGHQSAISRNLGECMGGQVER